MTLMRVWLLCGLVGSWTAFAAACTVGDSTVPNTPSDAPGDDAPLVDAPTGDALPDGSNAACEPAQTPIDGHHNPGQNCQVGGCHLAGNLGNGAPAFYISGTLYNNAAGTAPISGGTIVVVAGAGGAPIKLVTATNGNFYYETLVSPPFTVKASKCPDETPMIAAANTGACNSCHQVGTDGRIHLP